jgi:hypothetical protein
MVNGIYDILYDKVGIAHNTCCPEFATQDKYDYYYGKPFRLIKIEFLLQEYVMS